VLGPHLTAPSPQRTPVLYQAGSSRAGRDPSDLLFIQGLSFVVGSTEEEAQRKSREIDEYVSLDGLAAHISRDMGIDFGQLDPDQLSTNTASKGFRAM
jgi:alkanesulfonate monooxygenase SsuD/methylene tetrahydromethanopterin reductase-like flavin-dependent oxidoreductase (luciferase family)